MLTGLLALYVNLSTGAIREGWVDPHAWERPKSRDASPKVAEGDPGWFAFNCPACPATAETPTTNDNPGEFLYRKLINYLINEERMNYDQDTEQFHRTIHVRLSREQYDSIRRKGNDLRVIDGVLQVGMILFNIQIVSTNFSLSVFLCQDIWEQSKQGTMELVREVLWSWNESLHYYWTTLMSNRLFINTLQFAAIALVYIWAKDRGQNVAVIVVGVTAFYIYRYLDAECHRVCCRHKYHCEMF